MAAVCVLIRQGAEADRFSASGASERPVRRGIE